jgi:hypothetical protein
MKGGAGCQPCIRDSLCGGFSHVELEPLQTRKKLLGTWNQATLHRIHVHVLPEAGKFFFISDSVVIETALPDFSQKPNSGAISD